MWLLSYRPTVRKVEISYRFIWTQTSAHSPVMDEQEKLSYYKQIKLNKNKQTYKYVHVRLLGSNTMWICRYTGLSTFRRNILPPTSRLKTTINIWDTLSCIKIKRQAWLVDVIGRYFLSLNVLRDDIKRQNQM
jgi:hypothetical protein